MARPRKRKLTEDDLLGIVDHHINESVGYIGGNLSEQRREAMSYYLSEPFGDEIDGRSQFVSSDVQDTIEWMLPNLLEPFVAGDEVVAFNPTGEEDVEAAEQALEIESLVDEAVGSAVRRDFTFPAE